MTLGIMQPYFLPYIGYFQLINAVDIFVIYDNIQYTKKGWINRNRFLQGDKDAYFTLPLKKDSDFLDVKDRWISADFDKNKVLNQIKASYSKAPFFGQAFPLFKEILMNQEKNLFLYIYNSVLKICGYLGIQTEFVVSSSIPMDHALKSEDKVLAICRALSADMYINPIGGIELYSKKHFASSGTEIKFLRANPICYKQFDNEFISSLSILDVLMFNSREDVQLMLNKYELI